MMTSRSEKTLDLTDAEELAQALRLARQAKNQLEDMNANAKVLARVMVTHFDAYEAEILRLGNIADAAACKDAVKITDSKDRITELESEVTRLQNELKAIDRQRRQERNTW
jgi:hypothetical protein